MDQGETTNTLSRKSEAASRQRCTESLLETNKGTAGHAQTRRSRDRQPEDPKRRVGEGIQERSLAKAYEERGGQYHEEYELFLNDLRHKT